MATNTKKQGYIIKTGEKALYVIGLQGIWKITLDFSLDACDQGVLPGDIESLRKTEDGLYGCSFISEYSRACHDYVWGAFGLKPVDPSTEIARLRKLSSGEVKTWKTKMPGVVGELKKEAFIRSGAEAKKAQFGYLMSALQEVYGA